jgi:hypothetical protein
MKGNKRPYEKDAMNAMGGKMEDKREKWIQPQLIVLGRGTPEENVLAGCKMLKRTASNAKITSCKKKNSSTTCRTTYCSKFSTS